MVSPFVRPTVWRRNIPLELDLSSMRDKPAVLRQSHSLWLPLFFRHFINHRIQTAKCSACQYELKCEACRRSSRVVIIKHGVSFVWDSDVSQSVMPWGQLSGPLPLRVQWAQFLCAKSSWKVICPTVDVRAVSPLARCGIGQNFRNALENKDFPTFPIVKYPSQCYCWLAPWNG